MNPTMLTLQTDDSDGGRDTSLQQVSAGSVLAVCRERVGAAYRRDDGEPVVQGQRGAVVSVPVSRDIRTFDSAT